MRKLQKKLWLISKEEGLEEIYQKCEFVGRTPASFPAPTIPIFQRNVQMNLNKLIYYHFHKFVPTNDKKSFFATPSYDGWRKNKYLEDNKN